MKFRFEARGLGAVTEALKSMSTRRVSAALATALTRTAAEVKAAVTQELDRSLDRPTPYTMRSLYMRPARADRLDAEVWVKDDRAGSGTPATRYLLPQVDGGVRRIKRFELALQASGAMPRGWQAVPGAGAHLDAYGNISRGQLAQIISQVGTELTAGHNRTMSTDPRRRISAQRRAGGRFFAVRPGQRLPPGIYQREFAGRNITPVLIFVRSTAYQPRVDFYGVAQRVAADRLPAQVDRALGEQVARMGQSGAQQSFGGF
jgi:hypothetical protein